jgi:hypothetical protein
MISMMIFERFAQALRTCLLYVRIIRVRLDRCLTRIPTGLIERFGKQIQKNYQM